VAASRAIRGASRGISAGSNTNACCVSSVSTACAAGGEGAAHRSASSCNGNGLG
jgi:hypothetical protein